MRVFVFMHAAPQQLQIRRAITKIKAARVRAPFSRSCFPDCYQTGSCSLQVCRCMSLVTRCVCAHRGGQGQMINPLPFLTALSISSLKTFHHQHHASDSPSHDTGIRQRRSNLKRTMDHVFSRPHRPVIGHAESAARPSRESVCCLLVLTQY